MQDFTLFQPIVGLSAMDFSRIRHMLHETYWGPSYSDDTIHKFMETSLNFGVYDTVNHRQIAYARAVTDHATMYYVSDVVVDTGYRRQGVGALLMKTIVQHPDLRSLRGMLITRDAQKLYEKVGFENYEATFMHKVKK